jgi:hypothetical protein
MEKYIWMALLLCQGLHTQAQKIVTIYPKDQVVAADRLLRGDGDTYGMGDWQTVVRLSVEDTLLLIHGELIFRENANDFTTIAGTFQQKIPIDMLKDCQQCQFSIQQPTGRAEGENIGARGYKWFAGQGALRRVHFQTDTFGEDVGLIGGRVQYRPVQIAVRCLLALNDRIDPGYSD